METGYFNLIFNFLWQPVPSPKVSVPSSGTFQRSNSALEGEELSASTRKREMVFSLTMRLSVGSEMSLPHLADAVGSCLVSEECAPAPFVTDTKCFTRLELQFGGKKTPLLPFPLKGILINCLEHISTVPSFLRTLFQGQTMSLSKTHIAPS